MRRWASSAISWAGSTPSPRSRSATSRGDTGVGRSRRPRPTSGLALRQAGTGIAAALGLEPGPVTFVCSMRLSPGEGEPSTIETLRRKLDPYPGLRFKLDPTNDWTDELIAALAETGAIDSLDLK